MGARSILKPVLPPPFTKGRTRKITPAEVQIVEGIVANTPGGLKDTEVRALAKVMRRNPAAVQEAITAARDKFLGHADRYVTIHMEAVEAALLDGSAAALEQAIKGAQWGIANISDEGKRIVEAPDKTGNTGVQIMVGIKVGGLNEDKK